MVSIRPVALFVVFVLAAPSALAAQNGRQYEQGRPETTQPTGDVSGSLSSVGGASAKAESTSVSLDAIDGAPAKYDGKTLARRVVFSSDLRRESNAFTVGVKDAETGKRIGPGLRDGGVAFVVLSGMANRLGPELGQRPTAVVTFTVAKFPLPDTNYWVAVISRVEILGADGSTAKTIEPR